MWEVAHKSKRHGQFATCFYRLVRFTESRWALAPILPVAMLWKYKDFGCGFDNILLWWLHLKKFYWPISSNHIFGFALFNVCNTEPLSNHENPTCLGHSYKYDSSHNSHCILNIEKVRSCMTNSQQERLTNWYELFMHGKFRRRITSSLYTTKAILMSSGQTCLVDRSLRGAVFRPVCVFIHSDPQISENVSVSL